MTSERPRILVVDDEPDVVAYLRTLLEDHGYEVLTAGDGQEGLRLARSERPAAISLDISMPSTSGVRVYRELSEDPELAEIPVVMVTGVHKDFERFIGSRKAVGPPAGYVSKPFEAAAIVDTFRRVLDGSASEA